MPEDVIEAGESRQVDGYNYTVSREDDEGPLLFHDESGDLAGELMHSGGPTGSGYGANDWVLRLHPTTMLHGLGEQASESDAIGKAAFYIDAFKEDDE